MKDIRPVFQASKNNRMGQCPEAATQKDNPALLEGVAERGLRGLGEGDMMSTSI
jgi:hypothetical protein